MRFTTDGLARLFGLGTIPARAPTAQRRHGADQSDRAIKAGFDPSSLGLTEISSREKTMLRILFAAALLCAGSALAQTAAPTEPAQSAGQAAETRRTQTIEDQIRAKAGGPVVVAPSRTR